jgi:hypothetical protein
MNQSEELNLSKQLKGEMLPGEMAPLQNAELPAAVDIPEYLNPEFLESADESKINEGNQDIEGVEQNKSKPVEEEEGKKFIEPISPQIFQKEKMTSQKHLEKMINLYFNSNPSISIKDSATSHVSSPELEGKFGTRGRAMTKNNYDNVIQKLLSLGFRCKNFSGIDRLSIQTVYLDIETGKFKNSNIRTEIHGITEIQKYCETNDIINLIKFGKPAFLRKAPITDETNVLLQDVLFPEFNFSMSYKMENYFASKSKVVRDISSSWANSKKRFRHLNRIQFIHDEYPLIVDMSIVRSSKNNIPTFTIGDSHVFENVNNYEIEFEISNDQVGPNKMCNSSKMLISIIYKIMKFIAGGLQGTNYPIPYSEQQSLLKLYMNIISPDTQFRYIKPSNFIGPSSITLQLTNIGPPNENSNEPNIRNNFAVSEKADGERHLMIVSNGGKIYLMNLNMDVIFTGAITKNAKLFNTIIDGELILHDKQKNFINLFAAFDIYYVDKLDIRSHPFIQSSVSESASKRQIHYRYAILLDVIKNLSPISILSKEIAVKSPMRFQVKEFHVSNSINSIFACCKEALTKIYEYETDGLIFTPTILGVGSDIPGKAGPAKKVEWEFSFKWKPSEYNTIDFLISTKKDDSGQDIVSPIFTDGLDASSQSQLVQYKSLILKCGFNEKTHGYINPCLDVIEDRLPNIISNVEDEYRYKPMQFYPSEPYDYFAGICNITLKEDPMKQYKMFTEENQVFEDDTIVEFKFDKDQYDREGKTSWCWKPLRVRYDKTEQYQKTKSTFGNSYKTANSNWYSIHNPITREMITTGENIVIKQSENDVYYKNALKSTQTRGLRNFHNLFVKKMLITSVAKRGDKLIDYACGKGGDLSKWIDANLSFVFGIDVSKDNLENNLDGACARFLNYRKKNANMPYALFVNGDSSINIRSGLAMKNERSKQITLAVFGQGEKSEQLLGKGVIRQYDTGKSGFQISSCQFALHYFFKDVNTFHNFMRNVSECTAVNGYFIGTCYDGKSIFNRLKHLDQDEHIELYENGVKIWQIIKNYDLATLENDESCLGQQISVYQETINQLIPEFLVNFDYLVRIAENYGLVLLQLNEFRAFKLPNSTGMFRDLFNVLVNECRTNKYKESEYGEALNMSPNEKEISFLNRYFIFKKISNVDAEKVANSFIYNTTGLTEIDPVQPSAKEVVELKETIFLNTEKEKKPTVLKKKSALLTDKKQKAPSKKKKADQLLGDYEIENAEPRIYLDPVRPGFTRVPIVSESSSDSNGSMPELEPGAASETTKQDATDYMVFDETYGIISKKTLDDLTGKK